MRVTTLILAISTTVTAFVGQADAAPRQSSPVAVSYHDLNLATDAGRAALDRRIRRAADRSCGWSGAGIAVRAMDRKCRIAAIAGAQAPMELAVIAAERRQQVAAVAFTGARRSR
ncbi:UrcA family protein [Sphingomonas quercus]|uniref:UrcA family protein n=1 Tax=Sphingomonas quercus TaxID=2842451 RepID=A0ABS6BHG3_9SPHN|nr:UrcA family protein [Sphingomonas quercus]MBU3077750.1 UrcA family protein [Sphingomonas quercus]